MRIIQITVQKHSGKEFVQIRTNQVISWQAQYHSFAQRVVFFLSVHDLENLAGMATFKKSPGNLKSVYPVFGTIRGANPPVH